MVLYACVTVAYCSNRLAQYRCGLQLATRISQVFEYTYLYSSSQLKHCNELLVAVSLCTIAGF